VAQGDGAIAPSSPQCGLRTRRLPSAFLLHLRELPYAPAKILVCRKFGFQVSLHEVFGQPGADDLSTDAHDIDVVMFHRLVRGVHVMAYRGPNAFYLVGGNRGADTGTADEQAAFCFAVLCRR
jgi:hypothetical protein